MVVTQGLIGRSLAGAVALMVIGYAADFILRTHGYWFIGFMAGLIAGLMSVYFRPADEAGDEAEEEAESREF